MHVKLSKATEFSVRPEKRISFTVHETKELIQLVWEGQTELINIKGSLRGCALQKGPFGKWAFLLRELQSFFGTCQPQEFQQAPHGSQNQGLIIYANEGAEAWLIPNSAKCKSHLQFGP